MNFRKLRPEQHIMEKRSLLLIESVLPIEWVVHKYTPDYGIDLKIEVFEDIRENRVEALGEFILAEVKSVRNTNVKQMKISSRCNVAKGPLTYTDNTVEEIEVFKFVLDTSTILTVQSMGASVPVFLLYVTLDTKKIYFINLTDYIDKILIPDDPSFAEKQTKTLNIPVRNEITSDPAKVFPLRFAAVRMKLYAFFHKMSYQKTTMINKHVMDSNQEVKVDKLKKHFNQVLFLIKDIKSYDIWEYIDYWAALKFCYEMMETVYIKVEEQLKDLSFITTDTTMEIKNDLIFLIQEIKVLWESFINLGNIFEESIREQNLPSVLSNLLDE